MTFNSFQAIWYFSWKYWCLACAIPHILLKNYIRIDMQKNKRIYWIVSCSIVAIVLLWAATFIYSFIVGNHDKVSSIINITLCIAGVSFLIFSTVLLFLAFRQMRRFAQVTPSLVVNNTIMLTFIGTEVVNFTVISVYIFSTVFWSLKI